MVVTPTEPQPLNPLSIETGALNWSLFLFATTRARFQEAFAFSIYTLIIIYLLSTRVPLFFFLSCLYTVSGEHEPTVILRDNDIKKKIRLPRGTTETLIVVSLKAPQLLMQSTAITRIAPEHVETPRSNCKLYEHVVGNDQCFIYQPLHLLKMGRDPKITNCNGRIWQMVCELPEKGPEIYQDQVPDSFAELAEG